MFDAVEIGRRISRLRKEKDMTQPALADVMGVSFQAVSNWERGASMPDIGKLPELAQALGVSVDELLGGGRGGELIRSVIAGEEESFVKNERVTLIEAGEAAPLLKPRQVTRIVRTIEEDRDRRESPGQDAETKKNDGVDLAALVSIAPFLDEDYLDELALRLAQDAGMKQLSSLAPHLSEETLSKLARNAVKNGGTLSNVAALAPFLDEDDLGGIAAEAMQRGCTLSDVAALAPFLDGDELGRMAIACVEGGVKGSEAAAVAPFLEEEHLDRIVRAAIRNGQTVGELTALFPFLSQETLRALIEEALRRNDTSNLAKLTMFL